MAYVLKEHHETLVMPTNYPIGSYMYYATGWCRYICVTFVAQSSYDFARMALKLGRSGVKTFGPLTAELLLSDADYKPTGDVLAYAVIPEPNQSYPYVYWVPFDWNIPFHVTVGTRYAVRVWRFEQVAPAEDYVSYATCHYDVAYQPLEPNFSFRWGYNYLDQGPPPFPPPWFYADPPRVTYFRNYALVMPFAGRCDAVSGAAGSLTIVVTVIASCQAISLLVGKINGIKQNLPIEITGAAVLVASLTQTYEELESTLEGVASVTAKLTDNILMLSATLTGVATVQATLEEVEEIELEADIPPEPPAEEPYPPLVGGPPVIIQPARGRVVAQSAVTGAIGRTVTWLLAGISSAHSTVVGWLGRMVSSEVFIQSGAVGSVSVLYTLTGSVATLSNVIGELGGERHLQGSIIVLSDTSGAFIRVQELQEGIIIVVSDTSGDLTKVKELQGIVVVFSSVVASLELEGVKFLQGTVEVLGGAIGGFVKMLGLRSITMVVSGTTGRIRVVGVVYHEGIVANMSNAVGSVSVLRSLGG